MKRMMHIKAMSLIRQIKNNKNTCVLIKYYKNIKNENLILYNKEL